MLSVNKINQLRHNFWFLWFLILTVVFLIHCLTLAVSPPIWQDEVQIIEYGRTFLNPHTDWSINWDVANNRPYLTLFYLGCLVQELVFKASHFSIVGPRIFSLIGASLAATTGMLWLRSRQVPIKIAGLLGLTLLLDTLFVQSYRGDRIDCWVITLCLAACWLLRLSIERLRNDQSCLMTVSIAGSLSAIALFVWPSALILYPLILMELCSFLSVVFKAKGNLKKSLKFLLGFIFASIITIVLLLIPIKDQLTVLIGNFIEFSSSLVGSSPLAAIMNILTSFKNSPILPILAILGLIYSQDKALIFATLFALFMILNSTVYIHRVIYSLPYLIALVGGIYSQQKSFNIPRLTPKIKVICLVLLLGWATSLSLIIRPVIGLGNLEGRNLNLLTNAGMSSIGKGEYKIWDSTWQFYQTGRLLNWKLYQPFFGVGDQETRNNFLNQLDYIILPQSPDNPYYHLIEKSEFKLKESIKTPSQNNQGFLHQITKVLKSQTNYGPYNLYSKY